MSETATAKRIAIGRDELVSIEAIKPHPRNPNNGDLEALVESLRQHGQYRPLVVNERTNEVICGNHTYAALMQLNVTEVAVYWISVDEDEAMRIMIADNRLRDLAWWDKGNLVLELESLQEQARGLEGTGFDLKAIDELRAQIELPIVLDDKPFKGGYAETEEAYQKRVDNRTPGAGLREVVLMYERDVYEEYGRLIEALKRKWDMNVQALIVLRALKQAFDLPV